MRRSTAAVGSDVGHPPDDFIASKLGNFRSSENSDTLHPEKTDHAPHDGAPGAQNDKHKRELFCGDDFSDEGLVGGWSGGEFQRFAEHGFGFVEQRGVFGEEGCEGLVRFQLAA